MSDIDIIDKAIGRHDTTFSAYQDRLNEISEKIKKAEEYLRSKSINFIFDYHIESEQLDMECPKLWWAPVGETKKFRIIFNCDDYPAKLQMKPLIERPAGLRKAVYPYIVNLIEELAKQAEKR